MRCVALWAVNYGTYVTGELFGGCLLGGVYVPCIFRMLGGVIVGDWGLRCVPVQCVTPIV